MNSSSWRSKKTNLSIIGLCLTNLRYISSTMHRRTVYLVPLMKNQYTCALIEISEKLYVSLLLHQLFIKTQCRWCDSLLLHVAYNYFNTYVSIIKFVIILILWLTATWKVFWTQLGFIFNGGFSFLIMLRWAKDSFGPVAPPIDHLRNRTWPSTGHYLYFYFSSFIRSTTPAVRFIYALSACMCKLISMID